MPFCDRPQLPDGFQQLLEDLTCEVLIQRPADVIQFSIDFFKSRQDPHGCQDRKSMVRRASDDPLGNDRKLHIHSCPPRDKPK
nr:cAMP dependent protein kinase regulatory subunit type I II alpha beta [Hymenolepis microstoma]